MKQSMAPKSAVTPVTLSRLVLKLQLTQALAHYHRGAISAVHHSGFIEAAYAPIDDQIHLVFPLLCDEFWICEVGYVFIFLVGQRGSEDWCS